MTEQARIDKLVKACEEAADCIEADRERLQELNGGHLDGEDCACTAAALARLRDAVRIARGAVDQIRHVGAAYYSRTGREGQGE